MKPQARTRQDASTQSGRAPSCYLILNVNASIVTLLSTRKVSTPREMTRARFQSELKHVDDTIGGKIEDSSDFAARQSSTEGPDPSVEDVTVDDRRSRQSIREPETATRHAAFARLSRQNHSPQSQPIDNSPSSIPSTPSSFASHPNTTSTLLLVAASRSIVSVHLLSVATPASKKTFVSTSACGLTASGNDNTTTRAPAKAENTRSVTKITAPNFM